MAYLSTTRHNLWSAFEANAALMAMVKKKEKFENDKVLTLETLGDLPYLAIYPSGSPQIWATVQQNQIIYNLNVRYVTRWQDLTKGETFWQRAIAVIYNSPTYIHRADIAQPIGTLLVKDVMVGTNVCSEWSFVVGLRVRWNPAVLEINPTDPDDPL